MQIKDAYSLKFFEDDPNQLPKWCNADDTVKLPFCQIRGKYRMELPGYNTMDIYPHMNEKCPSMPPKYYRPLSCWQRFRWATNLRWFKVYVQEMFFQCLSNAFQASRLALTRYGLHFWVSVILKEHGKRIPTNLYAKADLELSVNITSSLDDSFWLQNFIDPETIFYCWSTYVLHYPFYCCNL